MYKVTKAWLTIERKAVNQSEEITLKMSNEVAFDNDCNAENIASCFDFIRSCLNFQNICEDIEKADSGESKTEKYMIENSNKKQVVEKSFDEVQEIIKEKNTVKEEINNENNNNSDKISSVFNW
jgi:hypothetical protein